MNQEIEQNFKEKLRLILNDLIESLDRNFKKMLAEHSRDGLLGSGNTIRRTMDFISLENAKFYQEVINRASCRNRKKFTIFKIKRVL